jgi:small subunit ribosomal protein S29e
MPHQLKSHPRKNCKDARACRITRRNLGLIRKYDIMLCRQAFRENADQIGFVKYR